MLTNCSNQSEGVYKVVTHVMQDLLKIQNINTIMQITKQRFQMILYPCLESQHGCLFSIRIPITLHLLHIKYQIMCLPYRYRKQNATIIAQAFLKRVVYQYGPSQILIIDECRTLCANIVMHIYSTLNIRSQIISPPNHQSLRTKAI